MRNIHQYILIIAAAVLGGCSFIEEDPSSALTEQEAFGSMSALRQNAVLSVYHYIGGNSDSQGLQGTGRGVYDLNSLTTDEQIIPTIIGNTIIFDAASFSVYALVYTVDFHWEVNGRMYDFSIPGGGSCTA